MKIKFFTGTYLNSHSYILYKKDCQDATIIDLGECSDNFLNFLKENNLKPSKILLTHAHTDHIHGIEKLYNFYKIPIYLNEKDITLYNAIEKQCEMFSFKKIKSLPKVTNFIKDNEIINILKSEFKVIETPGHTIGSTCFYNKENKILFTGDTLFNGAIGRVDLLGSSKDPSTIVKSIKNKLYCLEGDTKIYPGHMEMSTINHERENNQFTLFFPNDNLKID